MTPFELLDVLDDEALDRLPFGVVRLGPTGRIERINRAETERAKVQRWRALGRDYARELAPGLSERIRAIPVGANRRIQFRFRNSEAVIQVSRGALATYLAITPLPADEAAAHPARGQPPCPRPTMSTGPVPQTPVPGQSGGPLPLVDVVLRTIS